MSLMRYSRSGEREEDRVMCERKKSKEGEDKIKGEEAEGERWGQKNDNSAIVAKSPFRLARSPLREERKKRWNVGGKREIGPRVDPSTT